MATHGDKSAACGIYTPSDVAFARDGIAAEVSPNIETVITQDLDTELLRRARRAGTFHRVAIRNSVEGDHLMMAIVCWLTAQSSPRGLKSSRSSTK